MVYAALFGTGFLLYGNVAWGVIGLIVAVPGRSAARARRVLDEMNQPAYEIGVVAKGRRRVVYQ